LGGGIASERSFLVSPPPSLPCGEYLHVACSTELLTGELRFSADKELCPQELLITHKWYKGSKKSALLELMTYRWPSLSNTAIIVAKALASNALVFLIGSRHIAQLN